MSETKVEWDNNRLVHQLRSQIVALEERVRAAEGRAAEALAIAGAWYPSMKPYHMKPYHSIAEYMHQQNYWVCQACRERGKGDKGIETLEHKAGCSVARYEALSSPVPAARDSEAEA